MFYANIMTFNDEMQMPISIHFSKASDNIMDRISCEFGSEMKCRWFYELEKLDAICHKLLYVAFID